MKCSLTELSCTGQENIWLEVMTNYSPNQSIKEYLAYHMYFAITRTHVKDKTLFRIS